MSSSDADERGNWLALLKWSLKNSNDGTNPDTTPASVSEEDRAFLENAMKQVQNTPERLRIIMVVFQLYPLISNLRKILSLIIISVQSGGTDSHVELYLLLQLC